MLLRQESCDCRALGQTIQGLPPGRKGAAVLEPIRAFPDGPRYQAGVELRAVQNGLEPDDWKPMKTVGPGVREIRIRDASGAFRIIYLATLADRRCCMPSRRGRSRRRSGTSTWPRSGSENGKRSNERGNLR